MGRNGQGLLQGALDPGAHRKEGQVAPGANGPGAACPPWSLRVSPLSHLMVCLPVHPSCSRLNPNPKEPTALGAAIGVRPRDWPRAPVRGHVFTLVQSVPSEACGRDHYSTKGTWARLPGRGSWAAFAGEARLQGVIEVLFLAQGMSTGK